MGIRVKNTLTGKKEEFKPIKEGEVKIYLCGPTVYDDPHIGHLRSAYDFDVIRKYFIFRDYEVLFLRNVTDVDDKIIQKAKQLNSDNLLKATREISEKYYNSYFLWMSKFGIASPDIEPWATDHIFQMQNLIVRLIEKGYAYESGGDVYFSVRKFKSYGKLSGRSVDDMIVGSRVEPLETKNDLLDFAVWKKSKQDEPSWSSPWGEGRPGWHIECSAMSMFYFGESFDIHCGGRDLIFPHHENEIAQAEAVTGKVFAKYWLHNGMLTINGEKMSKSLGNFVTVEDVLKKYHPDVVKLFFLSANYDSPIDFTWERLEESKVAKERFDSFFSKVRNLKKSRHREQENVFFEDFLKYELQVKNLNIKFIQAMDDDFNTALAVGVLYELLNLGNKIYQDEKLSFPQKVILLRKIEYFLLKSGTIFSLFTCDEIQSHDYSFMIQNIIKIREEIRDSKQFELADRIRDILQDVGIVIEDGKENSSWRKI
ncbi:MAG: cysteine--tRNA ligase [Candidatus Saelkia tenebricola]|nr:cysteine--tRNA ligase [Candidatus Saelkia tenebricola]